MSHENFAKFGDRKKFEKIVFPKLFLVEAVEGF